MSRFSSVALRGRQFLAVNLIRVFSITLAGFFAFAPVHAQQTFADDEPMDEISVTGTRATIQSSINATTATVS